VNHLRFWCMQDTSSPVFLMSSISRLTTAMWAGLSLSWLHRAITTTDPAASYSCPVHLQSLHATPQVLDAWQREKRQADAASSSHANAHVDKERTLNQPSLSRALRHYCGRSLLLSGLLFVIYCASQVAAPLLLKEIIRYLGDVAFAPAGVTIDR